MCRKAETVFEDSVEASLDRRREELTDIIREECLDRLKDDLEGGLVIIILLRD
jgi:hypothetical protein